MKNLIKCLGEYLGGLAFLVTHIIIPIFVLILILSLIF